MILEMYKEVVKGVGVGWGWKGRVLKYQKRFLERKMGPKEGGKDVWKISQRMKTANRLRGGGGVISKTNFRNRGGGDKGWYFLCFKNIY